MERYTMFLDWNNQYCQNAYTTHGNLQIQCNPNQITNSIQYSCLENFMDRGVWWATVHGITRSQTQLRDFHFPPILDMDNSFHRAHSVTESPSLAYPSIISLLPGLMYPSPSPTSWGDLEWETPAPASLPQALLSREPHGDTWLTVAFQ